MTTTTSPPTTSRTSGDRRRWWGLIVISLAQLMIVLDITIVNVALPTIQRDLDMSSADRQWVVTAYSIAFGGLLLLGGRIADYLGRRRCLLIGLVGFAAASAVGGLAENLEALLSARAAQGAFGALMAPAALSLLSTTFRDPRERGIAFAAFGAITGSGSAVGLTAGGALTEYLDWHWVFYVNVPIALVAAVGGAFLLRESRQRESARLDVGGAVLATAGLVCLVYGFSEADTDGWSATLTLGLLIGGAVALLAFVLLEAVVRNPLLPLHIVARRGRGGAFLAMLLGTLGLFGMFYFLSFYLQNVEGYTPLETGVAFLPMTGGVLVTATLASRLAYRLPPRLMIGVGLLAASGGMAWLTQIEVGSEYAEHVLGPLIVVGLGLGAVFPTVANLVTFGVPEHESGIASATMNTAQQVGASIGTALLNTIAANRTEHYLASHAPGPHSRLAGLVDGYTTATWWGAGILATAGVVTLLLINARLGGAQPDVEATGRPGARGAHAGSAAEPAPAEPITSTDTTATVNGVVSGVGGGAIPGAVLTLTSQAGHQVGRATADVAGRYLIAVPAPNAYVLIASAPAHTPEALPVSVNSVPAVLDIALRGSAGVTGVVARLPDESPVPGALVCLVNAHGDVVANRTSDARGSYAFTEADAGTHTLMISAAGYRPVARAVTVAEQGQTHQETLLVGLGRVHGTARSASRGGPIGEIRITLLDTEGAVVAATDTDEYGDYALDDLAEGTYTLVASGYPPTTAALAVGPGADGRHDVDLAHDLA